jgi:hypothetical protein
MADSSFLIPHRTDHFALPHAKDADPDIPILKQAKTEHAKLHQFRGSLQERLRQSVSCRWPIGRALPDICRTIVRIAR